MQVTHYVLRSKTVNPYAFFDCEPVIMPSGALAMMKDGLLIYAFAPGAWQHVARGPLVESPHFDLVPKLETA